MSESIDRMSDLQKSFAKAKLANLPPEAPAFDESEENRELAYHEAREDDGSSASSASSAGTIRPSSSQNLFSKPSGYVWLPLLMHCYIVVIA